MDQSVFFRQYLCILGIFSWLFNLYGILNQQQKPFHIPSPTQHKKPHKNKQHQNSQIPIHNQKQSFTKRPLTITYNPNQKMHCSKIISFLFFISSCFCAYDADLAHRLCKLLVATYCKPWKVKDWSCKPCRQSPIQLTNVQHFFNSTGHVLGIIGVSSQPSAIVVAFRGTIPWIVQNDIQDNDNVKVDFLPCNGKCKAQRGFYHAYLDIAGQVFRGVRDYISRFQIRDVIVTGHSMGGPLATHCAIDLVFHGVAVKTLYSLGRIGLGMLTLVDGLKLL